MPDLQLKFWRLHRQLKLRALAALVTAQGVHMTDRMLSNYELGIHDPPVSKADAIAKALDITVDQLIHGGPRCPTCDQVITQPLPACKERSYALAR